MNPKIDAQGLEQRLFVRKPEMLLQAVHNLGRSPEIDGHPVWLTVVDSRPHAVAARQPFVCAPRSSAHRSQTVVRSRRVHCLLPAAALPGEPSVGMSAPARPGAPFSLRPSLAEVMRNV